MDKKGVVAAAAAGSSSGLPWTTKKSAVAPREIQPAVGFPRRSPLRHVGATNASQGSPTALVQSSWRPRAQESSVGLAISKTAFAYSVSFSAASGSPARLE